MEKLLGERQPRRAASLFGKYRLIRPLKRSPFLENYLAQTESPPHTIVVLKRLHPLVIHRTDWVTLFLEEVKQAATLWHPNIIRTYDLGQIDGVPYFVQPYLFGKKLQTLLSRSRSLPIPIGMALLLIRQLLEALDFVHGLRGRSGRPMAHGGLHPERIFIGYDGMVGVGDFGLGWLEDPRSAIRSRYRAPEAILERRGEAIPAEDLFAAAAILCELLGEFPEPIKPGMEPWGYLPAAIRAILIRGLAIEPATRFQAAREMIKPIESILQNEYPRLNLSNYIQAFFGKEIEAERRAFASIGSTEGEGSASGSWVPFERREPPPADPIPPMSEPSRSTSPDLLQEPPSAAPAASVLPATSAPLPEKENGESPVAPAEKEASPWQPIWWSLFGLMMAGFVGVLFFSLYRSSSDNAASSSTSMQPPVPTREAPRDPMGPPPSPVEEKVEVKEHPGPSEETVAPPPMIAAQPTPAESPSAPTEKPKDRIKETAPLSTPQNDSSPVAAAAPFEPIAPPDAPVVAAKRTPAVSGKEASTQPKVKEIPSSPKTNEEMIHALIERQRRAFQNQDGALYRQDRADGKDLDGQMGELFAGTRPIRVEFEIFELKIQGEGADLSLMQTARLRKGKTTLLQKSLLFWKLKKENDRWKIEKFNIIEKYPPVEVG